MARARRVGHRGVLLAAAAAALGVAQPPPSVIAQLPRVAVIDAAQAGPDFLVQGEYLGTAADGTAWGLQVAARGEGRFFAVVSRGGLPGEGAEPDTAREGSGQTAAGRTRLEFAGGGRGEIADGALVWRPSPAGEEIACRRVERRSPTLDAPPPAGAIVLYAGPDQNAFRGNRPNRAGWLMAGARSQMPLGDGRLHLEFAAPFMPNSLGQDRGNSGVYLQRRYEIQILDSFALAPRDNDCGALYAVRPPDVNMCFPPLAWQTLDVDFRGARFDDQGQKSANARVTVRHNGVLVHDDAEFPESSGLGDKESPRPGPLYLQYHLDPVQFRNIWFLERSADAAAAPSG